MWLENPGAFAARHGIGKDLAVRLQCTGEHLVARQDGGDSSRTNIVAACLFCNATRHQIRQAPSADEYRQLVARGVQRRKWHPPEILRLAIARSPKR
ncbi:HNH endonuclease [uncultured Thiodictyon sp.]|uniref:HNH endonuclease n=1 Tax=uncultured Thiodictyon sp. TaxID=1846217 RepID=UPI00345A3DB7